MKLSHALDGYWLDKELEFSKRTIENYSMFFRYLSDFLGDREIEAITSQDIRRFLSHLAKTRNYSKRSVHNAWIALSSLWTWAEKELSIPHVIRNKVPSPKYTQKVIEIFTQDDIKKLIHVAEFSRVYESPNGKQVQNRRPTALRDIAIIYTLLDSGARNSELCTFTIKDYDQKSGKLFIRQGKNDKQRFVVLGNRARKAVWRYLTERKNPKPNEPLFAAKNGERMDRDNLRHMLNILGKRIGLEVYPHKFRHTFAVNFLRNGGNIFVLQALLGHSSLEMVRYYARIAEIDLEQAVKHSVADNWRI